MSLSEFSTSGTNRKLGAIFPRRQPEDLVKDLAESARIFVPDRPRDLLDILVGEFQHLARLADAEPLAILRGLDARRPLKPAQEGALFQARLLCHRAQARVARAIGLQPVLNFQDLLIAMIERG